MAFGGVLLATLAALRMDLRRGIVQVSAAMLRSLVALGGYADTCRRQMRRSGLGDCEAGPAEADGGCSSASSSSCDRSP